MESTLIHSINLSQLQELFAGLSEKISNIEKNLQPKQPAEYLTRAEVAQMFKCDLSTIHNWCKKGKLKPLGIGNRVYFLRSEIEQQLTPLND